LIVFCLLVINLPALVALAADYQLLEPSVLIDQNSTDKTPEGYNLMAYLKTAYLVLFVVVISAVVFWFILGGLGYILSDLPSVKNAGKKKLTNALIGLAIALSSVLLLQLINPDLLKFKLDLTGSNGSQAASGGSH